MHQALVNQVSCAPSIARSGKIHLKGVNGSQKRELTPEIIKEFRRIVEVEDWHPYVAFAKMKVSLDVAKRWRKESSELESIWNAYKLRHKKVY